jgi:hypothetical protein
MVVLVFVPVMPEPLKAKVIFERVNPKAEALLGKANVDTEKFVVVAVGAKLIPDIVLLKVASVVVVGTPTGLQFVEVFKSLEPVPSQVLVLAKTDRGTLERTTAIHSAVGIFFMLSGGCIISVLPIG